MLAENLLCRGGIERFFHRSFLWAFHTLQEPPYWAEVERRVPPLQRTQALDLLMYENNPENLRQVRTCSTDERTWLRMSRGFAELKDHYNKNESIPKDVS